MKGTRPLDNKEIRLVSACFDQHVWGRAIADFFMLGVSYRGQDL